MLQRVTAEWDGIDVAVGTAGIVTGVLLTAPAAAAAMVGQAASMSGHIINVPQRRGHYSALPRRRSST